MNYNFRLYICGMSTPTDPLSEAIRIVGMGVLSKELRVTHQAIRKWLVQGRMPRTEWTDETDYSRTIERLTGGAVTRERLLEKWRRQAEGAAA